MSGTSKRLISVLAVTLALFPFAAISPAQAKIGESEELRKKNAALRERLKTRVKIVGGPGRGRIEIEYFGAEDLGRIASAILDG